MANPETCWHRIVVWAGIRKIYYCGSCGMNMGEFTESRHYDYDIEHNVWVYAPETQRK